MRLQIARSLMRILFFPSNACLGIKLVHDRIPANFFGLLHIFSCAVVRSHHVTQSNCVSDTRPPSTTHIQTHPLNQKNEINSQGSLYSGTECRLQPLFTSAIFENHHKIQSCLSCIAISLVVALTSPMIWTHGQAFPDAI